VGYSGRKQRLLVPGVVAAAAALLVGEAFVARRGEGSPEAPGSPDVVVGEHGDPPLRLVVLGDSTGSGVGAVSQDLGYPRRVARALAGNLHRRVELRVFAVSGARVHDVLTDQLARLGELKADVVLLVVGGNDVTHLASPARVRVDLAAVLDRLGGLGVPVVVAGIPAMGTATRIAQPLRVVTGMLAARVYDPVWREQTRARRMFRVDLADLTGPQFARDPSMLAPDGFHPGPRGYEAWAKAITPVVVSALASVTPT
jgi:lysophospholipase L1-like esterase